MNTCTYNRLHAPKGHVTLRVIKTTTKLYHNTSRLKKDFQYCVNPLNRLLYEH